MVIRQRKNRKYLGARSWGAGNIKNHRGKGDRGGTGKGGIKHKFTRTVKYEKERLGKHGFKVYARHKLHEINLGDIENNKELVGKGDKPIELPGYKVLGGGKLSRSLQIKASSFSNSAIEKIKAAGGEAIKL